MAFSISPGVTVSEIDLTTVVPAVATTTGAIAGLFRWGPVLSPVLIGTESQLVNTFGKPSNLNPETFFTAANFLAYGNALYVGRAASNGTSAAVTATSNSAANSITLPLTTAINVGDIVYSSIVPANTQVSTVSSNSTTSVVTLTQNITANASAVSFLFANATAPFTAIANTAAISNPLGSYILNNRAAYDAAVQNKTYPLSNDTNKVPFIAKYPGALGSSLLVSVCAGSQQYSSNIANSTVTANAIMSGFASIGSNTLTLYFTSNVAPTFTGTGSATVGNSTVAWTVSNATAQSTANSSIAIGDIIALGNTTIGTQYVQVTGKTTNTISLGNTTVNASIAAITLNLATNYNLSTNTIIDTSANNAGSNPNATRYWQFFNNVNGAPGTSIYQSTYGAAFGTASVQDEVHVVVQDAYGYFTGIPGTVLETFQNLSRNTDAKTTDGATLYYRSVINDNSVYVYNIDDVASTAASANTRTVASVTSASPTTIQFAYGSDGADETTVATAAIAAGYDLFRSPESIDISLVLGGRTDASAYIPGYITDNITQARGDCVAFISPRKSDVVNQVGLEAANIVNFRNNVYNRSSTYAVMDTGYKYQYDKYNDVYRYIPLNGDVAGLCARTDNTNDPWWSPAGYNRGQILNTIKLAYNPKKADRDLLYQNAVNPVVTFPGQGTVLFGDKTLSTKPSAFDRINVRRLFIVLEKAIKKAAQYTLFEFNDDFTRTQFINLIDPYLRDIQGRRGITDYRIVCDTTNNTAQIINNQQFVGDIYIKPARAINFIQLNFVAVRTGVDFSTIVGQF